MVASPLEYLYCSNRVEGRTESVIILVRKDRSYYDSLVNFELRQ
jgi:hypothetical protein